MFSAHMFASRMFVFVDRMSGCMSRLIHRWRLREERRSGGRPPPLAMYYAGSKRHLPNRHCLHGPSHRTQAGFIWCC